MSTRGDAKSTIFMITDGTPSYPSDEFQTKQAADQVKKSGARLVVIPVGRAMKKA
jgi:uncharacterized protein YegL